MRSVAERVAALSRDERRAFMSGLSESGLRDLAFDWGFWGRVDQQIPPGDWSFWLILAGRGWGKTRTGGEAVKEWERGGVRRFHFVGPTAADVRDVMVEGESGILNLYPRRDRPLYEPTKRRLTWPRRRAGPLDFSTGESATATLFSADRPDRLRGPQCEKAWLDEPAAWRYLQESWDNLVLGLRLGRNPQAVLTTTPRPLPLIIQLAEDKRRVHLTRGSTYDNVDNLAPLFADEILSRYEGTRLGRQEIYAEILYEVEGALWTREWIERDRWRSTHDYERRRTAVAIDPAVSTGPKADETAILVGSSTRLGAVDHYIVEGDYSGRYTPDTWGAIAVNLYHEVGADVIVAEKNQGGDLVEANIKHVDPNAKVKLVHASRGKIIRAEPIAGLYEQRRVHHLGTFGPLEDQMCTYVQQDRDKMPSPDRMDGLVWLLTHLSGRHRKWSIK